jgi:hypothetical protein
VQAPRADSLLLLLLLKQSKHPVLVSTFEKGKEIMRAPSIVQETLVLCLGHGP